MKKLFIILAMVLAGALSSIYAQDTLVLYIENIIAGEEVELCIDDYQTVAFYKESNCNNGWRWYVQEGGNDYYSYDNPLVLTASQRGDSRWCITYQGCVITGRTFFLGILSNIVPSTCTQSIWKHPEETEILEAVGNDSIHSYEYHWSTGATTGTIEVTEPGTYSVEISHVCGSVTRTFIVRDNVELYRATVDLETNLNKATWQVMPEQAEYISEVKVYRDGLFVGNAPYEQGFFLDAIGSDNAARNYQVVGVTPDGEECPFGSYEKGTIHTTYYQDVNSNLNMTWNIPYVEEGAQGTLTYFQICKYDPVTGDITVVDQVNASITDYTCGVNQFDGGQAVIAAVFSDGKGVEELAFSNLTTDILGVGEDALNTFRIYPNPSNGTFTVEGAANITVYNVLGQVVATCRDGACTVSTLSGTVAYQFTLPSGIYTVRNSDGIVRKVVVE